MLNFFKYHGTGNDFVIIDNRNLSFNKNTQIISQICDRRFGVGGDGLILLENTDVADFKMVYFNANGNESTMCGNGGRCIVAFAYSLGIFQSTTRFLATDGFHEAEFENGIIKLKMIDVAEITSDGADFVLNTGSPHYVKYVTGLENYKVYTEGNKIRNSPTYCKDGINVNFVEVRGEDQLFVRTYERGVEDETYSCGTGVTASALTFMNKEHLTNVRVKVLGGHLQVSAQKSETGFKNIWLEGPAECVFRGQIKL